MKRLSLRARLTLVYGGLFLLAGMVLLAVTYVLVQQRMPNSFGVTVNPKEVAGLVPKPAISGLDTEQLKIYVRQVQAEAQRSALNSLLTQGGIALALVSAIAIAFGWLIAGRALQPLHQITGTARRIAGADTAGRGLHERIALSGPRDEVRELADTFDGMLERLDRSFDGQRRFVANASHELRTPLALNRSLVELAITRPGAPEEVKRLGEALLGVNERHERLIEGLLTLADSETELTERSPVDLAEVAVHVIDQALAAAIRPAIVGASPAAASLSGTAAVPGAASFPAGASLPGGASFPAGASLPGGASFPDTASFPGAAAPIVPSVAWESRGPTGGRPAARRVSARPPATQGGEASWLPTVTHQLSSAPTSGDPILLERLTHNLVENAIRHNLPESGWISVRTEQVDGQATLVVSNTGPVVPGYEIETMFQPFRRLRRERLGGGRGFGLGLSIVRAVARAHGGSVDAQPRPGGGLVVTVALPSNPTHPE